MSNSNEQPTDKNKQALDKKEGMAQPINKPGEGQVIEKQGQDKRGSNERAPDSDKSKSDRRS